MGDGGWEMGEPRVPGAGRTEPNAHRTTLVEDADNSFAAPSYLLSSGLSSPLRHTLNSGSFLATATFFSRT